MRTCSICPDCGSGLSGGFPLVFYVEGEHAVVVWRILHASRDIPASLLGEGD